MREALEANETGKAGYVHLSAAEINRFGTLGDCLVVERWQPSAHYVDDAVTAVDTQVVCGPDIRQGEHLVVAQALPVHALEETQHSGVRGCAVGHEQIAVLGRANIAMSNHGEAANHNVVKADGVSVSDYAD
jgi:hypothetical protein